MKKLLITAGTGIGTWCGVSESISGLSKALNSSNIKTTLVVAGRQGIYEKKSEIGEVYCLNYNTHNLKSIKKSSLIFKILNMILLIKCNFVFLYYLLKLRPSSIYVADISAMAWAILPAKILKIKLILAVRGEPQKGVLWRTGVKHSNLIIALSENLMKILFDKYNERSVKSKTIVIPNAINNPIFCKSLNKYQFDKEINIGYVGMFSDVKNQKEFISNILPFISTDMKVVNLWFFGDAKGEKNNVYFDLCENLLKSIKGINIKFFGFMDDVNYIYSNVDIIVLCSKTEGQPRVILEAVSHNIPFISFDVPSVVDIAEKTKKGIVVYNRNNEDFRIKLNNLINDYNYFYSFSKSNNYIDRHYIDNIVDSYIEVI